MTQQESISSTAWNEWQRKRRRTLIGYVVVGMVVGIDYSVALATLYLYLKNEIKTSHPEVCYGVIIAMFGVSSIISGLIAGRWVDRTRKVKRYLDVIFSIQIIGSLMYTVPYSVLNPLIGRILVGIGDPFINVCSGEVIRIYDNEGGNRALWWIALTYSFGFIVGPGVSLIFKGIRFNIGPVKITYLNFVGIFMAVLLIGALFITNVFIHDCSAEIDLKEYLKQHDHSPNEVVNRVPSPEKNPDNEATETTPLVKHDNKTPSINNDDDNRVPWQLVIKTLSTYPDPVLIFISTFFFMYCLFASDVIIPLLCIITFEWDVSVLTYIFVGYGLGYSVLILGMSKLCNSTTAVYNCTLFCNIWQIIQFSFLLVISLLQRHHVRDTILFVLFLFGWLFSWCIEEVLLRSIMANMVPSQVQSFTETLRAGVARLSTIIAALTTPLLMPYLHWWSMVLIVLTVAIMLCFVVRISYLREPKEVKIFRESTSFKLYEDCAQKNDVVA